MRYNFIRIHKTLRVTPAMAAGVSKVVMNWEDFVALMDVDAPRATSRGPYKNVANCILANSIIAFLILMPPASFAAETMVGPAYKTCAEFNASDPQKQAFIILWVAGFASGVNNLTPSDFLKNQDMKSVLEILQGICVAEPNISIWTAAQNVVARMRMDAALRPKNSN